jgi:hypothetical protein
MFKKKKSKSTSETLTEISARLRGFILDSQIQNAHELAVILGCSAISEDVQEREEEESEIRLERISHLVPLLYAQAHALSEGAVEYQKTNLPDGLKDIPNDIWMESRKMMEHVSLAALLGSVSQLVDMGLLELPKKKRKKKWIL